MSFPQTTISEANKHLQLLHAKIEELELTVTQRTSELEANTKALDEATSLNSKLQTDLTLKDKTIDNLTQQHESTLKENETKDSTIQKMQARLDLYQSISKYKGPLYELINLIEKCTDEEKSDPQSNNDSGVSTEASSPSIKQMVKNFGNIRARQFSISEDEDDTERDTVMRQMVRDKELYL